MGGNTPTLLPCCVLEDAGALKHGTGDYEEADDGGWTEILHITKSKAQALIDDLEELKDREPDSKILIFRYLAASVAGREGTWAMLGT